MATINKVTELLPNGGQAISSEQIQAHLDVNNQDGWYLVGVDNLVNWYRFFWAKVTE